MEELFKYNFAVGRVMPSGVQILGSAFLASKSGHFVTAQHVVGESDTGLVIIMPRHTNINDYQDSSNRNISHAEAVIESIDKTKDIAILRTPGFTYSKALDLGSVDEVKVGGEVIIVGYPHCVDGRLIATVQNATVGAKVLLTSAGQKLKHAIANIQARPGQSGSLVYCSEAKKVVGMLVGTYIPESQTMISLLGINPAELNQTTHIISAEYMSKMI